MDTTKLEKMMVEIADMKVQLGKLGYDHEEYDEIEENLHDLEDDLLDEFGDELEETLEEIHESYCPDTDVLLPTAYIAQDYVKKADGGFDVTTDQGVLVDVDKYPGKECRMVFLPKPIRLVIMVQAEKGFEVWPNKA